MTISIKNTFFIFLTLLLISGLFYFAWINYPTPKTSDNSKLNITHVKAGEVFIEVESVVDSVAQARGLSGRESLGENKGMLFIFPESGLYPFWMKDMKFPIDIIWISEFGKVVHIKKNALPTSYPDLFVSEDLAKYVLEVPNGFTDKHDIKVGAVFEFLRK